MNKIPLILVTNDDGITSKGIRHLVEIMKSIGEVVIVAPDSPQSGMGHAITVGNTIRLEKNDLFGQSIAYECSGTPADCVKIAKHHVLKNRQPDLVVSGVNHGSNTSISVLYSGTMSAAIEASIEGIPSIGFSLCDFDHNADFTHILEYIKKITTTVLNEGIDNNISLNVNFPQKQTEPIKGIKICKQANASWQEEFQERYDPNGRRYFWMAGNFVNHDASEDNDEWAIANNYIAVVPVQHDLTAYNSIEKIKKLNFN